MTENDDHDLPEDIDENLEVSKSARKREAEARRALGRTLTRLEPKKLQALPLPDDIRQAVEAHQRIRSNGAARRQLLFLAGLLRKIDPQPIIEALNDLEGASIAAKGRQHALERWRERLLLDPNALTAYLNEHPQTDRQQLRNLLTRIRKSPPESLPQTTARRELFRFLRANEAAD